MRKLNRKGRNKWEAKHVRLYDYMLSSTAYLSLTCPARAVLIEIARVYNGANNGRLGLSVRAAAKRCRLRRGPLGVLSVSCAISDLSNA